MVYVILIDCNGNGRAGKRKAKRQTANGARRTDEKLQCNFMSIFNVKSFTLNENTRPSGFKQNGAHGLIGRAGASRSL